MLDKKNNAVNKLTPLSRLEQRVMGIVWKLGECSSAEVIAENNKRHPRAETTIRTVLTNLRHKGYLELVPTTERQHCFRATVSQESVGRQSLREIIGGLFAGSPRRALMYMVEDDAIDETDLEVLRKAIEERKRRGDR
ncbi:MAG TPA: BlaI/MecI/CopY family transcriptional regulator [Candidatus Bathyarchaeia archaeon]|nr:BlaI/MecI/CopY family transcriptional regulator [Candidatus Bathyarchaeia archaeon]